MDRNVARSAILDAWADVPYAQQIGERDRAGIGMLRMVDAAIDALHAAGWTPPDAAAAGTTAEGEGRS